MVFIDVIKGNLNFISPCSPNMSPIWPFKKKKSVSRLKSNKFTENIVEYERNDEKKTDKNKDTNSHLKSKKFLDAMKIIDEDK